MFLPVQMQYRASAVDKMKIEPAMISFMENTTSSKTENDRKLQFFLWFLKVPNEDKWSE